MIDFNGFDKGVIGKKLPADTTLNNMRKADLIELLHIADHNHDVLVSAYKVAVDNSKCNQCPLGRDRQKIRVDAIEEVYKEFEKIVKSDTRNAYYWTDLWRPFMCMIERLKEQENG